MTGRTQSDRIPSLDGLRAVAIALVLLGHLVHPFDASVGKVMHHVAAAGAALSLLGVYIFFVISGYLITSLLLAEHERTGSIDLGRFYLRRTLRIFPAYYVYVGAVAILTFVGVFAVSRASIVSSLTYTMNYCAGCGPGDWYLGHGWSLAVEEQFYLLWPAALILATPRRASRVALIVIVACPVLRLGALFGYQPPEMERFEHIADALAYGCLLALWRSRLHAMPAYVRVLRSRALAVAPILVAGIALVANRPSLCPSWLFTLLLLPVALASTALYIDRLASYPTGAVYTLLNRAVLVWIGGLSYSLYLWQQLFLGQAGTWWQRPPLNLIFALAAAFLSQRLIERPALVLRARLASRPARPDSSAIAIARE